MLETPSIPRYLSYRDDNLVMIGDNAAGADNQQERPGRERPGILRDYTPGAQRSEQSKNAELGECA